MKKLVKSISDTLFHRSDLSYKLFGEYVSFSGKILLKSGEVMDVENADLLFRGDFIVFVDKCGYVTKCNETAVRHERITLNVNSIKKILN